MRTPEEILDKIDRIFYEKDNKSYSLGSAISYENVCEVIKQSQKEAYNEAIEDAAREADVKIITPEPTGENPNPSGYISVNIQSILNLRKTEV